MHCRVAAVRRENAVSPVTERPRAVPPLHVAGELPWPALDEAAAAARICSLLVSFRRILQQPRPNRPQTGPARPFATFTCFPRFLATDIPSCSMFCCYPHRTTHNFPVPSRHPLGTIVERPSQSGWWNCHWVAVSVLKVGRSVFFCPLFWHSTALDPGEEDISEAVGGTTGSSFIWGWIEGVLPLVRAKTHV